MSSNSQEANLTNTRATNDKALNVNANIALANENTFNCCIFGRRKPLPVVESPKSQLSIHKDQKVEEIDLVVELENLP